MRIILIAYKHNNSVHDYSKFFDKIEKYSHTKVTETCCLINTSVSPKKIYRELRVLVGKKGDALLVLGISKIWKGHGPANLMDWISKNIELRADNKNTFLQILT